MQCRGCGGIAWPVGIGKVLSRYIVCRGRDYWKGKRVLGLGSGTGLVGLVAGYLGAHAVLTDQRSLVPHQEPIDCANDLGQF